jgi:hypothetical protein
MLTKSTTSVCCSFHDRRWCPALLPMLLLLCLRHRHDVSNAAAAHA